MDEIKLYHSKQLIPPMSELGLKTSLNNYADLLVEKFRLENKIFEQHQTIREELIKLKEKFAPFLYLLPFLSLFKKRKITPILNVGMVLGLIGRRLLSKAHFIFKK